MITAFDVKERVIQPDPVGSKNIAIHITQEPFLSVSLNSDSLELFFINHNIIKIY